MEIHARGGQHKLFGSESNTGYAFKADIKHYFDNVDPEILLHIIKRKIKDEDVIRLIKIIFDNHKTDIPGKGMPIGNLTSQFFANVYLNELDQFVKHRLKAKYYIRYVDDFIVLHKDRKTLEAWRNEIDRFLRQNLKIELHPDKSKIIPISNGITLLGFRVLRGHKLLKKSNAKRIWKRLDKFREKYDQNELNKEQIELSLEGWLAYAKFANTYKLRKKVLVKYRQLFY